MKQGNSEAGKMGDMEHGRHGGHGEQGGQGGQGGHSAKKSVEERFQSKRPFPPLSHDDQFGKSHRGNQLFKPLIFSFCFRRHRNKKC